MRVALIHSFYRSSAPSGENVIVEQQRDLLQKAGHEVFLISQSSDGIVGHPLRGIRTALNVATEFGVSPVEALHDINPDVVHVHNLFPTFNTRWLCNWNGPLVATMHNFRSVCANALMFRGGKPCRECLTHSSIRSVVHRCYHDSLFQTIPLAINTRRGAAGSPLLARANALVLLSTAARDEFQGFGVPPSKMWVIPNGLEIPQVASAVPSNLMSWLVAGRLSEEKGILDLLAQWPPDQPLTVVGDGPLKDSVIEAAAKNPQIVFLGQLARKDLLELMRNSIGLVFPSKCFEMQPTVIAEACASALPIVCRDTTSPSRDIKMNEAGLVYGEMIPLPEALGQVQSSHSYYSQKALSWYRERFSAFAWVKSTEGLYRRVIEGLS